MQKRLVGRNRHPLQVLAVFDEDDKRGGAASTCYIISKNARIDALTLGISEAMGETVRHQMGTRLVFGDAEVLYYESETMEIRYISKPRQFR